MLEGLNQKLHFAGADGTYWWIGQIASESSWKENIQGKPTASNSEQKGFGERYRIRILARFDNKVTEMEDEDLPWAMVKYPVTAGGGGRSSFQSANLTQGAFVTGSFLDGRDAQNPIIDGIFGYNDFQAISKLVPQSARLIPFSGYTEEEQEAIATYTVKSQPGGEIAFPNIWAGSLPANTFYVESAQGSNSTLNMAGWYAKTKGLKTEPLAETEDCKPMPMGKIQKEIQNLIQDIQNLQKSLYDFRYGLSSETADIKKEIDKKLKKASEKIASFFKDILAQIEKGVLREVNNALKKVYFLMFPNDRPKLKKQVETANDLIACLFKKIIQGLLSFIANFLGQAAQRIINTAECFVNNALGQLLGQLLSGIQNGINSIFGGIESLIGQGIGLVDAGANIIKDVLSFLKCEENNQCEDVNQWSLWAGPRNTDFGDIKEILSLADSVSSTINNTFGDLGFDIDVDGLFNTPGCSTGARACGPPTVDWVGVGKGALGNLIISAGGAVIGYDMISLGEGYDDATSGYAYDDCGYGSNAVFTPVLDENGGIQDIIIEQGGTDYLPAPNGCKGGDGRVWACEDDTEITHSDGTIEVPIPPDYLVEVQPGDTVNTPCGTEVVTEPIENDPTTGGETIPGCGNYVVQRPGKFTTPRSTFIRRQGAYPTSGDGSYPVILYLCEIIIKEAGINYQPGDEVIIKPDLGAKAEIEVDGQGRISAVKVTESGEGFQELPKVYVRSETGFQAKLLPKFCVDRVGEDEAKEPELQDKIVTVIDCVGKF